MRPLALDAAHSANLGPLPTQRSSPLIDIHHAHAIRQPSRGKLRLLSSKGPCECACPPCRYNLPWSSSPQGLESVETPLTAALHHSGPPMACPCKSRLRESLQPGHSVPSPVNHDNLSTTACQPVILHARPGQRRCVVRHRYVQRQLISSADMCIVAMRKVLISSRDTSPVLRLHHVNGRQIMAAGSWEASPTVQWP